MWPGFFRTWFTFSDWFLHVFFSRFQHSNLHFGSLLHSFIKLPFAIRYSFAKDFCPCLLLLICKGLLSILVLSYSFGFCCMFTKGRGPSLPVYLQRTTVLISRFVYKGPQSLSSAIHLQRTNALVLWYSFSKNHCPCLCYSFAKDAVLVWCYLFAKDCHPCLRLPTCKGPPSLSYVVHLHGAISLQRKLLFLLSTCCPRKIRWTAALAKHGETAYPPGLVKTAVSQIST